MTYKLGDLSPRMSVFNAGTRCQLALCLLPCLQPKQRPNWYLYFTTPGGSLEAYISVQSTLTSVGSAWLYSHLLSKTAEVLQMQVAAVEKDDVLIRMVNLAVDDMMECIKCSGKPEAGKPNVTKSPKSVRNFPIHVTAGRFCFAAVQQDTEWQVQANLLGSASTLCLNLNKYLRPATLWKRISIWAGGIVHDLPASEQEALDGLLREIVVYIRGTDNPGRQPATALAASRRTIHATRSQACRTD